MLKVFVLGVLVGWLAEWLIDWFWWRRRPGDDGVAAVGPEPLAARREIPPTPGQTGDVVSADTSAGTIAADVALGAPGAVSTSSASLSTQAPVYRQVDLEAIPGLGPRLAALLRQDGIATFQQLADAPEETLARIVQASGDEPDAERIRGWRVLARRATVRDWAGFASAAPAGR